MTLDYNNTVPSHCNTKVRSQTVYFNGADKKDLWESNLKDPEIHKLFEKNGWLDKHAIPYTFNTHGFRCKEFDDSPGWLALGCSFTEGVGLNIENVWPSLLTNHINEHIWNLGIGGGSMDTCFRILDYYIDKLNVQGVFLLEPPHHRFELFINGVIKCYLPTDVIQDTIFKSWHSDANNSKFNAQKNLLAIKKICDDRNIRVITKPSTDIYTNGSCLARDLVHSGKDNHVHLANLFYEDYKNGNS
jgi:hypothetical protein